MTSPWAHEEPELSGKPNGVYEVGGLVFAKISNSDIMKLFRRGRGTEPVDEKMAAYLSLVTQHFHDLLNNLISHMKEDDRPGGIISFNIITQDATDNIKGILSGKVSIPPEAL